MNVREQNHRKRATLHEVEIVYKRPVYSEMETIRDQQDVVALLRDFFDPGKMDYKESFAVILLSQCNKVLGLSQIGVGGTSGVVVNQKEIFQLVLKSNACCFILAHNHPSGNLTPSEADIKLTNKLKQFAELIDIKLLDHIILTSESWSSVIN